MSNFTIVKVADIVADKNQPRKLFELEKLKTLRDSVQQFGILTPIVVEKIGEKYLLVDGERRFRVATELKLKEIPATMMAPESQMDRLVKQFHIQEQHESWTATEKAQTVYALSKELGIDLKSVCELLALTSSTAARYLAFAELVDKKSFVKNDIGIEWAPAIKRLKVLAKKIYQDQEKVFTRPMEADLEKAVISRIKNGELNRGGKSASVTKIVDSFTKNPKLIEKFLESDVSVDEMFVGSKAKVAFHLRNAITGASYITMHIREFLKDPDLELSDWQINVLKGTKEAISSLLSKVE